MKKPWLVFVILLFSVLFLASCSPASPAPEVQKLVVYSGRSESLVAPVIADFETLTGIDVEVRYGDTAELAVTLLEEGENSPADVFFAQDPGGLGAIADLLSPLPAELTAAVFDRYKDSENRWVGVSGRARVVVFNTDNVSADSLPADIRGFTDPAWKGRIGWAPTNASFQTMVTAMRKLWGEEDTRAWLEGILANEPVVFDRNAAIVAAVGAGEIDAGFVNHYYLMRALQEEGSDFPAQNYFFPGGGPESLVMTAGVGILDTAKNRSAAEKFVQFLVSSTAQQYFTTQTFEYPVIEGIATVHNLPPLDTLNSANIALTDLSDLQGTLDLLRSVGALP